jgi:L-cysteate sulfo-lyase
VVEIACVYEPADVTGAAVADLVGRTSAEFGLPVPGADRWAVTDATLGAGYGIPTEEGMAAIDLLARTEGVLLDPVYTSKAFAHLLATHDRDAASGAATVFVHTGGSPGLFAYAGEFDAQGAQAPDTEIR